MDNKKSYVYKITCKITGEFYFGSSFSAKRDWYWGTGRIIKERISKYGKENFVKEILGEFDDRTIALQVENKYIEKFRNDEKCLNKRIEYHFKLYGEESRKKIGATKRGKHFSYETRAKISDAQRGEKNHNFGKHFSEEHKAKLSAAFHGKHWRKNPVTGKREWYD